MIWGQNAPVDAGREGDLEELPDAEMHMHWHSLMIGGCLHADSYTERETNMSCLRYCFHLNLTMLLFQLVAR